MLFYLSEPSYAKIESISLDYVNKRSCFLKKFKGRDKANRDYSAPEIKAQILKEDNNTVVYFKKTIAPSRYRRVRLIDSYDYSGCTSWGNYIGNCPRIIYKYIQVEVKPCSKNN